MESYNCSLPEDIITDILSRLPAVFLLSLKQVCKTWRDLLVGPNFARIHLRRQQYVDQGITHDASISNNYKVSFLCFLESTENQYQQSIHYREYLDDENLENLSNRKFTINFKGLPVDSCNGLICFSSVNRLHCVEESPIETSSEVQEFPIETRTEYRVPNLKQFTYVHNDPTYIFNPVTGEELRLPELLVPDTIVGHQLTLSVGFGYLPSTGEYKVVRIYYQPKDVLKYDRTPVGKVQVYTLGGESSSSGHWRNKCDIPYHFGQSDGVFFNGALHWVQYGHGDRERIMAFDLGTEEFFVVKSPPDCFQGDSAHGYELCRLGGCLGVYHNKDCYNRNDRSWDIWVLKKTENDTSFVMDENEEYYDSSWSWSRIFSIDQAELSYDDCLPLSVTKSGEILFKYRQLSALCIYEPKTATFRTIPCLFNMDPWLDTCMVLHVNTFVSLKGIARELQEIVGS
ncbi:F-box protein At3g07870-like [Papaver somniferum]|uniref:F-box protein At3g07870-like n=1 Tax=Papaver somniferum TaxID=3469 RepID=UPI000E70549A|nr:F-box protein At3g07870-like [Papaver somniferum]